MNYVSAKEIATKWNISQRRVSTLCSEGRVVGATMVGNTWIIPYDAIKPIDARTKEAEKNDEAKPFLKWAGGKGQLLKAISKYYPFEDNKKNHKICRAFCGWWRCLIRYSEQI